MKRWLVRGAVVAAIALLPLPGAAQKAAPASCGASGIALQVLGSGGPELAGRASTSYLIWRDGKAAVIVDLGGGAALRFREAGAKLADVDLFLLSHLHVDHSADLPVLIKSDLFERRRQALPLFGPVAGGTFPATTAWVKLLTEEKAGAFAYLSDYLTPGILSGYSLKAADVALARGEIKEIFSAVGIKAAATTVTHSDIPALAWRVEIGGKRIVFSGDGDGRNGNLERLAENADVLIAHLAVPEGTHGGELDYHMPPSSIGRIAAVAKIRQLILGHRMTRTIAKEEETRTAIAREYKGPLSFADDLTCYSLK